MQRLVLDTPCKAGNVLLLTQEPLGVTQAGDPGALQLWASSCPSGPGSSRAPSRISPFFCLREPPQTQECCSSPAGRASLPSSPAAVPSPPQRWQLQTPAPPTAPSSQTWIN